MEPPPKGNTPPPRPQPERGADEGGANAPKPRAQESGAGDGRQDYRKAENRRGNSRRGGRRRRKRKPEGELGAEPPVPVGEAQPSGPAATESEERGEFGARRGRRRRGRNRSKNGADPSHDEYRHDEYRREGPRREEHRREDGVAIAGLVGSGMFMADKGGFGTLRKLENQYLPTKQDIFVPQRLVQRFKLREGAIVEGPLGKGKKYKYELEGVTKVDGKDPKDLAQLRAFKSLTTIDPDFHYAVGDVTGDVSMRILDIIAPIGRGQRGLIVAQPRTGKTTLMRQFAKGIELGYPDVHLFVLLVDERPEEATDWVRSTKGQVFVSTSDEPPKNHVRLAEAVWKRCQRLVELGEDVVLILDSITRLARAYNNNSDGSGRTMSGGLDSRAMERPRQIFGSARNTETAGSLTILGTALIDTGSRMDQLIFEEFKGTGNMEVMLNRKLADRRIFPAIDIEKSGTRKEEKIVSSRRLKRVNTLRRVLLRMNFIEAMELLSEKLLDVEKTEDFLQRFDVDPEA
jgi:transcription termination factor Rho